MKLALIFIALALLQVVSSQVVGGWQPIDWTGDDQELNDLLDWGVQEAVWEAVEAGELESGEWAVSEVNSASQQIVAGINYEWDVDIDNGQGQTQNLDLVVFDQSWTDTQDLVSWSLNN